MTQPERTRIKRRILKAERRLQRGVDQRTEKHGPVSESEILLRLQLILRAP